MAKTSAHLVFIPAPAVGHLVSTFEIAKLLLDQHHGLSITMLLVKVPFDNPKINSYSQTLSSVPRNLTFLDLPLDESATARLLTPPHGNMLAKMIEIHKTRVKEIISEMITKSAKVYVVVDMFCTPFMDVARDLGIPSYVFLTSGAGFLGLVFHLQSLQDDQNVNIAELVDSGSEFDVPSFGNRVPAKVLPPDVLTNKSGSTSLLTIPRWFRQAEGILVNTFAELEPHAVKSLSEDTNTPQIYPVGPLLNLENDEKDVSSEATITNWLDDQPPDSVVYLCFGSRSTFDINQTREIAIALERSNRRFLWSLQKAPVNPESEQSDEFLPEGFLDRMIGIGMVIGWAPQVAILSHPAVGGFVSHCGWNSTLESMWFGVPMGAWPRQAEQHINAFSLVCELGSAVEIKIDNSQNNMMVTSNEIEVGIRRLMDPIESKEIRENVKKMKEGSRGALRPGGSSYSAVGKFIEDLIANSTENVEAL